MAFLALGSMFSSSPNESQMQHLNEFASEAYHLLPEVLSSPVNLDGLQTLLLLVRYHEWGK